MDIKEKEEIILLLKDTLDKTKERFRDEGVNRFEYFNVFIRHIIENKSDKLQEIINIVKEAKSNEKLIDYEGKSDIDKMLDDAIRAFKENLKDKI